MFIACFGAGHPKKDKKGLLIAVIFISGSNSNLSVTLSGVCVLVLSSSLKPCHGHMKPVKVQRWGLLEDAWYIYDFFLFIP